MGGVTLTMKMPILDTEDELRLQLDVSVNQLQIANAFILKLYSAACPGWAFDSATPDAMVSNVMRRRKRDLDEMNDQLKEVLGHLPGGHFCQEWDGLFILPVHAEWDACLCYDDRKKAVFDEYMSHQVLL